MRIYYNRKEAGESLANALEAMKIRNPVVVALPRGGVPVAYEVAERLKAPLDVLITRKIGAPHNPEYGIGAISENGTYWINEDAAREVGASDIELQMLINKEKDEIRRRKKRYRADRPMTDLRGKTVILVDDGLATGVTARVSVRALREMGADRIILAVPVCAPDSARILMGEADEVICLEQPSGFYAVGAWYQVFDQTSDEEVTGLLERARHHENRVESRVVSKEIQISDGTVRLPGTLSIPVRAKGIVLFAHGSGSSRRSPRNVEVAQRLNQAGLATLLFDLLDPIEAMDRQNVFDIPFLASRLILAYTAIRQRPETFELPVGFFGASTGGGAALWAAAILGDSISAVVSRGGRPDLAMEKLPRVSAPTLLIIGGEDKEVIELNRRAHEVLPRSKLLIIAGATHLFEEPGTLETVAEAAKDWFVEHFSKAIANVAA